MSLKEIVQFALVVLVVLVLQMAVVAILASAFDAIYPVSLF